jgi:hypothetical protein
VRKKQNPEAGDLVTLTSDQGPEGDRDPWIVIDFFPWGMHGKHAWSIVNPKTGAKKIILKGDWATMEEKK